MHLITVSGLPGSGTTTVCGLLTKRLGWRYANTGQVFRQMAAEADISLDELGQRAESDARIDRQLDARTVEMARTCEKVILEGRLCGWMARRHGLPALKVWLEASPETRVRRVSRRDGQSLGQAMRDMVERERSESKRYAEHHGIDIADLSIYDLVIDTEQYAAAEVAEQITTCLECK
jgi:predicted cytidylate kinase